MLFTTEHRHDDGVVEREFTLDGIPGILWTPPTTPAPLLLLGPARFFVRHLMRGSRTDHRAPMVQV